VPSVATAPVDVVFITPPASAHGWILRAFCEEIGGRLRGAQVTYCRFGDPLPPARRYFFSHYMFFVGSQALSSPVWQGRSFVFATHLEPEKHRIDPRRLSRTLNRAEAVICMNAALRKELHSLGVEMRRLHVLHGAADPRLFIPHKRTADGLVGFCSAFYERKAPDRVLEIVCGMPHRRFVLVGKGWANYSRIDELTSLPNFEYVEVPYDAYPDLYRRMSVFVSVSMLEGGPIPLIEAMMSNVVPVSSRTGFAPDLIEHGRNGLLFDVGAPTLHICQLIDQAYDLDGDIHPSVHQCSWDAFAAEIFRQMELTVEETVGT